MWGDGESIKLAEQIIEVLLEAGWEVKGLNQVLINGGHRGIWVVTPEKGEVANTLIILLNEAGFDAIGDHKPEQDKIEIIVGWND